MRSLPCTPAVLLWLVVAATCARASSGNNVARGTQHLRPRDVRKLQPGFWLKVAAKHLSSSPSANTPACSRDYGEQYLQRWRALQGSFCNASAQPGPGLGSSVRCHAHPEADLSTCLAHNLLLGSSSSFLGSSPHASELPQPKHGSIQLACNRTAAPTTFLRGRLSSNEGSRAWLVTAPSFGPPSSQWQHACSDEHAVAHAVLLLLRVDPENAFHNLETVVSVFGALAVLQLQPAQLQHGLQVVVADDRQQGSFMAVWRRLSWPHPLRVLRQQPFPDNTCLSTAILAPYTAHTQSLLTYKAGSADEVLCESLLLQAASRWLRHLFRDLLPPQHRPAAAAAAAGAAGLGGGGGIDGDGSGSSSGGRLWSRLHGWGTQAALDLAPLAPSPTQSAAPLQLLHVVWVSRRRFEQQHAARLTDWQKARVLPAAQQEALLVELQRAVLQWNEATCVSAASRKDCQARTVMFGLQVAELSELSFYPDQLGLLMRTGVLAGVHGAGLANQVFMPPRAGAVVEVWWGMQGNTHYSNMAHMLGHAYHAVEAEEGGVLDVARVVGRVREGMDEVAARHAAAARAAARGTARRGWWRRQRGGGGGGGGGDTAL